VLVPQHRRLLTEWDMGGTPGSQLRTPLDVLLSQDGRARDDLWGTSVAGELIPEKLSGASRVWVLQGGWPEVDGFGQFALAAIRDHFKLARTEDFGRATAALYVR
jgi:hypothetical protein